MNATTIEDLRAEIDLSADSTVSKTVFQTDHLKAVLFAFAERQELSEHTAAVPAVLHFLDGRAEVTLGEERLVAVANCLVHLPANLPHSITALEPTRMLLLLLKSAA